MSEKTELRIYPRYALGTFGWLGGAFYVWNQPGMTVWDALIWLWYVGRFVAKNFTVLAY